MADTENTTTDSPTFANISDLPAGKAIPAIVSTELFLRTMRNLRTVFDQASMWSGLTSSILSDMGTLILSNPEHSQDIYKDYVAALESTLQLVREHSPEVIEYLQKTGGDKNKAN